MTEVTAAEEGVITLVAGRSSVERVCCAAAGLVRGGEVPAAGAKLTVVPTVLREKEKEEERGESVPGSFFMLFFFLSRDRFLPFYLSIYPKRRRDIDVSPYLSLGRLEMAAFDSFSFPFESAVFSPGPVTLSLSPPAPAPPADASSRSGPPLLGVFFGQLGRDFANIYLREAARDLEGAESFVVAGEPIGEAVALLKEGRLGFEDAMEDEEGMPAMTS